MTTASLSPRASRSSRASSTSSATSARYSFGYDSELGGKRAAGTDADTQQSPPPPPLPQSLPSPPALHEGYEAPAGEEDRELPLSPPSSVSSSMSELSALTLDENTTAHPHRVMFGHDVIQVPLKQGHEYVNLVLSQREFDAMAVHLPQYDEMPPEELVEQTMQLVKDAESRRRHRLGSASSVDPTTASDSLAAFQSRVLELEYERKRLHTKLKAARALQASLTDENTALRVHLQEAEQTAVDYEQLYLQNELLREQSVQAAAEVARFKRLTMDARTQLHEFSGELQALRSQVEEQRDDVAQTAEETLATLVQDVTQREKVLQHSYLAEKRERESMAEKYYEVSGRIRVFCRLRPAVSSRASGLLLPRPNSIVVAGKAGKEFAFDQVFGPQSTQSEVYAQLEPLVVSFSDGYNACIMAYGQTGSGKTHTMVGNSSGELEPQSHDGQTVHATAGMIPRALQQVFAMVSARKLTFADSLKVSYVEIYNDQLLDLLHEGSNGSGKNVVVRNEAEISTREVTSYAEVDAALRDGGANRNIAATSMNLESSRSHALVFLHLTSRHRESGEVRKSTLCLVDLAGSERISRSQVEGERLRETQHINKSLAALGDVVYALQHKAKHTPYRNSKLTYMLREMLSGQAKTLLMLQLSPDAADVEESTCSLQFGARVSQVQMGAVRPSVETGELVRLQEANRALEARVLASEAQLADWQRQCQHQEDELHEAQSSNEALERQLRLLGGRRSPSEATGTRQRQVQTNSTDRSPSPPRPSSPASSVHSARSVSSNVSARSTRSTRSTANSSTRSAPPTSAPHRATNVKRTPLSTSSRTGSSTMSTRTTAPGPSSLSAPRPRRTESMLEREARRKSLSAVGADKILDRETRRKSLSTLQTRSSSTTRDRPLRQVQESSSASLSRRSGAGSGVARSQSAYASRLSQPRNSKLPVSSPSQSNSSQSPSSSPTRRTSMRRPASSSGSAASRSARTGTTSTGSARRSTALGSGRATSSTSTTRRPAASSASSRTGFSRS